MSPKYKLCYFNARGFGEMCRLLFAEAGIEYEDVRYTQDEWPKHKSEMMFGQMPVLFVDGEQIAHSRAACRYLAREFGLDGGNSLNAAKMDMWIEVLVEAFMKLPFSEQDKEKKRELSAAPMKDHIIPKLELFQKSMKGVYLFGDKPSAVDIFVYSALDTLERNAGNDCLKNFKKIKDMAEAMKKRPKIAKWIEDRPKTEH